jgi:translation initiation factor IF-1|tara:strand:+ start:361 stop:588 length:228 start_codon:yes stop_codon:yes gene_type:complete
MSKKSNIIEAKGIIFKESGNGYFNVELEEPKGHNCLCRASGRLITRKIQLLVGDRVTVELSPYDLDRGRITLREK